MVHVGMWRQISRRARWPASIFRGCDGATGNLTGFTTDRHLRPVIHRSGHMPDVHWHWHATKTAAEWAPSHCPLGLGERTGRLLLAVGILQRFFCLVRQRESRAPVLAFFGSARLRHGHAGPIFSRRFGASHQRQQEAAKSQMD